METDSQLIISVSSINRVAIVHGTLLPSCKRPGSVSERPLIRGILIFNLAAAGEPRKKHPTICNLCNASPYRRSLR